MKHIALIRFLMIWICLFFFVGQSRVHTFENIYSEQTSLFSLQDNGFSAQPVVNYYFPWKYGVTARVSQGHHDGYSIDFQMLDSKGNNYTGPVTAAADGTILEAKSDSKITCIEDKKTGHWYTPDGHSCEGAAWKNYTNYVAIKHADGHITYYLHLAYNSIPQKFLKKGQAVLHGEVIGQEGKTGIATNYHLHFQMSTAQTIAKQYSVPFEIHNGKSIIASNKLTIGLKPVSYNFVALQGVIELNIQQGLPLFGKININGWAKDVEATDKKVSKVQILVDGIPNNTQYGIQRSDQYNGLGYKWGWDTSLVPDGSHTLVLRAFRSNGAYIDLKSLTVQTHNTPPTQPTNIQTNCGITNNVWQNSCSTPTFTWQKPASTIGIKGYNIYWGPLSQGIPNNFTTSTSYIAITPVLDGVPYYLRISSRDILDRDGAAKTVFTTLYDVTKPSVAMTINNNAEITTQVNVNVQIIASDADSGLSQMRVSDGLNWSAWQPFASEIIFTIRPVNHANLPVIVQVKDLAGNIGEAQDSIQLNLDQVRPSSANFLLCAQTINVGGGVGQSQSFQVFTSFGEVTGSIYNGQVTSGFVSHIDECPMALSQTGYQSIWGVIDSSGEAHHSSSYLVDGILGQISNIKAISQSYQIYGGIWNMTNP